LPPGNTLAYFAGTSMAAMKEVLMKPSPSGSGGGDSNIASALLPVLGSILGGGGPQRAPPRQGQAGPFAQPTTATTTTTTTTTTTEKVDDRPGFNLIKLFFFVHDAPGK